ncbi:hypothetical protein ACFOY4_06435 [Actinomadura syzygii]|uniref:HPF/RaiA family ribosome-associated protein n=1 Tax=Actinomadura syzygii TaxID=1427538 RepID=A0A5D0TVT3_9ACTN|nr:hypothetical protein [Actinomadura syzygii]TYC10288.1 hypothetical protein FXF65_30655 [Actinomadura syzygii]
MPGTVPEQFDIQVTTTTDVAEDDVRRAHEIVTRVLAHAPRPVLHVSVTLSVHHDPAVPRPNLVSLRVDLNGLPVNAHAAAASMQEAIGLAGTRLRARVESSVQRRDAFRRTPRHTRASGKGEHRRLG